MGAVKNSVDLRPVIETSQINIRGEIVTADLADLKLMGVRGLCERAQQMLIWVSQDLEVLIEGSKPYCDDDYQLSSVDKQELRPEDIEQIEVRRSAAGNRIVFSGIFREIKRRLELIAGFVKREGTQA